MDYGSSYEKDLITLKPERKFWQKVKKFMPNISVSSDAYKDEKLYEGTRCLSLVAEGCKLTPCRSGLDSIYDYFQSL
jgi:hypothetical protein